MHLMLRLIDANDVSLAKPVRLVPYMSTTAQIEGVTRRVMRMKIARFQTSLPVGTGVEATLMLVTGDGRVVPGDKWRSSTGASTVKHQVFDRFSTSVYIDEDWYKSNT